ncbi:MAG: hypothetical protein QF662_00620 [Phycisphaerae bacterium]|jgi:hypothetical protein|nr:hypothetical protein [Phycisphaerae bacterium]
MTRRSQDAQVAGDRKNPLSCRLRKPISMMVGKTRFSVLEIANSDEPGSLAIDSLAKRKEAKFMTGGMDLRLVEGLGRLVTTSCMPGDFV